MNALTKYLCLCLGLILGAGVARADLKITTKTTTGGQSYESTTYIKGTRQRTEQNALGMANILQCDLKKSLQLNDRAKKYMVMSTMEEAATDGAAKNAAADSTPQRPAGGERKGGVITYINTITDTGERKKLFGFTARRLKTSMTVEASPDACQQPDLRTESDGWYIDLQFGLDCQTQPQTMSSGSTSKPECQDRVRFRTVGGGRLGYPAQVTTTMYMKDGKSFTSTQEIVSLTTVPLEAALFDVPAGYTEARSYQELMGVPSVAEMTAQALGNDASGQANNAATEGRAAAVAPKNPDAIRIGVISVNNRTNRPLTDRALRERLINHIIDTGVDAVTLSGGTPSEVVAEAKSKDCDFILYTDVVSLKQSGGGRFGGLIGRASGVPGLAGKYEARVDFRLLATGDLSPVLQSTATAKDDGGEEGSVSRALEREAQMIAEAAKKK